MTSVEGIVKYLEETGLDKRFENLKPGDSFGVELPIDEENGKFLRFWLTAEGSEDHMEYLTLDFEGLISVRLITDEKKLEKWVETSGILELAELSEQLTETKEEVVTE